MTNFKFQFFTFLISSILIFTSCLDNQIPEASDEALFSQIEQDLNSTSIGEEAFENAESLINAFTSKPSSQVNGMQKSVAVFPIVTLVSESDKFPRVYEINYGDEFYDAKKNLYKGIIIYTMFSYKQNEYQFKEFYINNNHIEGYRKGDVLVRGILNMSSEEIITNTETKQTSKRYTERTRTVIDNNKTDNDYTDDSYEFTGYSKGTTLVNGNELEYSFQIEKPLVAISGWKYFVSGLTHLRIGKSSRSTDYGKGELDNIAIRTVNDGKPREIFLNWGVKK